MNLNQIKLEKHFEALLQQQAISEGCHVVPLPDDCKIGLAAGDSKCKALKKPYDFGICHNGKYMAVECKLVKGATLHGSKIEPHQHKGLIDAAKAGAFGVLAIFFMFKKGEEVVRETFFIDYSQYSFLDLPPSFSYNELVEFGWLKNGHVPKSVDQTSFCKDAITTQFTWFPYRIKERCDKSD